MGGSLRNEGSDGVTHRDRLRRWAMVVLFCSGGMTTAALWDHSFIARWIGGVSFGTGLGRWLWRDD